MNPKNILIILGNPARERKSFCEALAHAYSQAASVGGHKVEILKIAEMTFDPILHEGYKGTQLPEPDIVPCQQKILNADHLVIIYPLWQFMIPALLKGFFERTLTPGFAYQIENKPISYRPLKGKSARIIQTMGMPTVFYSFYFFQHGAKALSSALRFLGLRITGIYYCGLIESKNAKRRDRYLKWVSKLGSAGI